MSYNIIRGSEKRYLQKEYSANNGYEVLARAFVLLKKFNIYRGLEKRYLTRLITLGLRFDSGTRNNRNVTDFINYHKSRCTYLCRRSSVG